MQLKEGDKVLILNNFAKYVNKNGDEVPKPNPLIIDGMLKYVGQIMTIYKVIEHRLGTFYSLEEDDFGILWASWQFKKISKTTLMKTE